jgi:hypothetical protein
MASLGPKRSLTAPVIMLMKPRRSHPSDAALEIAALDQLNSSMSELKKTPKVWYVPQNIPCIQKATPTTTYP